MQNKAFAAFKEIGTLSALHFSVSPQLVQCTNLVIEVTPLAVDRSKSFHLQFLSPSTDLVHRLRLPLRRPSNLQVTFSTSGLATMGQRFAVHSFLAAI